MTLTLADTPRPPVPPFKHYSSPVQPNQPSFLQLHTVPLTSNRSWEFVTAAGAKSSPVGVEALLIVDTPDEEPFVLIQHVARPPLAGLITDELPAGIIDPGETIAQAASREVDEETGYQVEPQTVAPLLPVLLPQNASVLASFNALVAMVTRLKPQPTQLSDIEKLIHKGDVKLPLSTFMDDNKFNAWLNDETQRGHYPAESLLVARELWRSQPALQRQLMLGWQA
jgi:8-oxo-dGTP pyrophosphatase MutT (NUDIX family)